MPVDPSTLDAEEYLDRYGVTAYMKDVVTLLLENRPASPIAFMSKYFRTVTQGSSPLLRAYRYIKLASPTQDAFIDNLVSAYVALDARRGVSGVTGAELLRLLRLLCGDCPIDVSRSLLVLLDRTESDPVSFDEFSAAVRAGLHYDDFFTRARTLFSVCDPNGSGAVPRSTLQLATRQVRTGDADGSAAALSAASNACGGASNAAAHATSVAARTELHRLQREVQCEVAYRLAPPPDAPPTPAAAAPSEVAFRVGAGLLVDGAAAGGSGGAGGGATSATVQLEEFLNALFAASLHGHEAAAAALQVARPQSTGGGGSIPPGEGRASMESALESSTPLAPGSPLRR